MSSAIKISLQQYIRAGEIAEYIVQSCAGGASSRLSIAVLSKHFCMSTSTLTRIFKQRYAMSIHAFIMQERVKQVCSLLQESAYSIKENAMRSGYEELSNFSRDFTKHTGMSPRVYRQVTVKSNIKIEV